MADLFYIKRTNYCGDLRAGDIGKKVVLKGWVNRRRDHGGVIFVDLRDRTGICQIVFNPDLQSEQFEEAHSLRNEYTIGIIGTVRERPEGTVNPNIATGEVEVVVETLKIFNKSEPVPFRIEDDIDVSEEARLRYRYLDLRRPIMQQNIMTRAKITKIVRDYLSDECGFIEVETPILTKSTPEGARDYLVPSRVNPGQFYALPQSPQLFKQILMIAGYDRYYQIARCFRDEDLRADRQPEFTQIDIEMSFITPDDIIEVVEGMIKKLFKEIKDIDIETPIQRMSYSKATLHYGIDRPDIRFGLLINDVTDIFKNTEFKVFKNVVEKKGIIRAFVAEDSEQFSRKYLDDLTAFVGIYGAKGLAWLKVTKEGLVSPIEKFLSKEEKQALVAKTEAKPGSIIFIVADKEKIVCDALANLRLKVGKDLGLIDENKLAFVWILDFPLFEYDEKEKRLSSVHHPFTSPVLEDIPLIAVDPLKVKSLAYDLVLNGTELGGGSIRIHNTEVQKMIFTAIGISEESAKRKFGFLLEALDFGAPPHGGIAFGLDRICMLMLGGSSIRDVIPFPKTQKATCLLTDAPSPVEEEQLKELGIQVINTEEIKK